MKKILSTLSLLVASVGAFAQGLHDLKINEVYVYVPQECSIMRQDEGERGCYVDEYGQPSSWIEIENTSYTTHDIRSCFLTTNPQVLDKSLSAPQREKLMSRISTGDPRTSLAARQRITFFADGHTNRGTLHLNFTLPVGEPFTVYLFDGNAVDLLDSVRVESLPAGASYARIGDGEWQVCSASQVTPNAPNVDYHTGKIQEFKEKDPHGIAMTLMCMGVVFLCLILLFVFFHIFGWIMRRLTMLARVRAINAIHQQAVRMVEMAKQGTTETKGIDMETYAAVIGLALHEYFGGTHDLESGVLTIVQAPTPWADKSHELRPLPPHHQATK